MLTCRSGYRHNDTNDHGLSLITTNSELASYLTNTVMLSIRKHVWWFGAQETSDRFQRGEINNNAEQEQRKKPQNCRINIIAELL